MTYETPDGPRVAEGTASLASSGNGLVTWQYNGFGEYMRYESYFVRFDVESDIESVQTDFAIYPNPTSDVLNIPAGFSDIKLFDITGRVVYTAASVESTIDLSTLTAGTYILTAFDGEEYVSTKVIKN